MSVVEWGSFRVGLLGLFLPAWLHWVLGDAALHGPVLILAQKVWSLTLLFFSTGDFSVFFPLQLMVFSLRGQA